MRSRPLFASAGVTVSEVWCDAGHIPESGLETEPEFGLSLPRSGVYVHLGPRGRVVADPSVAVIHSRGDEHVTSHPTVDGDRNTDIQYAPDLIEGATRVDGRFGSGVTPVDGVIAAAHRRLLARARAGGSPLETEEEAVELLARVLAVPGFADARPSQRAIADDARQLLAERFRDDLDLLAIAREVGASPFHLSRMFKRVTGRTLSEHRIALRLSHAMDAIMEGADDLSSVALEAGFFDHAHMANTFRHRLGLSPSGFRSQMAQKRKDLQAGTA
jgi:AraC-like DNA-binding protein